MKTSYLLIAGLLTLPLQATSIFSSGDASGDPNAPTPLGTLSLGSSEVSGSVVNTTAASTRDIFSFSVASGFQLDGITLVEITQSPVGNILGNAPDPGFFFLDIGTTTEIPGSSGSSLLSGALIGETGSAGGASTDIGDNILFEPNIAGGPDITSPLAAGDYIFGIQQTGPEELTYTVSFEVSAIPEPSSALLLGLGSFAFFLRRKR